jgi:hypothetical protein
MSAAGLAVPAVLQPDDPVAERGVGDQVEPAGLGRVSSGSARTTTGSPPARSLSGLAGLARASGCWSVATGGPGGFPVALVRHGSRNPLWSWAEVEAWFARYEPLAVRNRGSKLSADFLAELNDRLDLRERLLHTPDAPWRSRLAEALPLGA